jgi:hypothetical protein
MSAQEAQKLANRMLPARCGAPFGYSNIVTGISIFRLRCDGALRQFTCFSCSSEMQNRQLVTMHGVAFRPKKGHAPACRPAMQPPDAVLLMQTWAIFAILRTKMMPIFQKHNNGATHQWSLRYRCRLFLPSFVVKTLQSIKIVD